jgi:glycosyltransferase involved in cell wall biosynthesis
MRVVIARPMPEFSMDVYAEGVIAGLRSVRPDWDIVDLSPCPVDRNSRSLRLRAQKYYERFWNFPHQVRHQIADVFHIIDHSEAHLVRWLRQMGKPVVVTCHDLINYFYQDNLQGSVQLPFVSNTLWLRSVQSMQAANHIVAVSDRTAQDVSHILNVEPDRIAVIPNAVETAFQPLPHHLIDTFRRQMGVSADTFCLLNVGSNHPRKNISTILKTVEILQQSGQPIQFWKTGADFTEEQRYFIDEHGLQNCIRYLGNLDKSSLVQVYNAADVLVTPSLHEGFGMTILEAMACGTPVITSNTSAMPEVAGDAGILVDPNHEDAIVAGVLNLLKNSAYRQELISKGLARAKQFTWESTAEQIAQVYEKSVNQKVSHRFKEVAQS